MPIMPGEEPVCVRNARLFESVLSNCGAMRKTTGNSGISHDALLDSFLVIYDECSKELVKKDINVSYFIKKYKTLASEIKSLRVGLSDFNLKTTIGHGQFGEVRIAEEIATGDVYAIKIINKAKTLLSASGSLFEEERDIMCLSKSPWHVGLQYAFQDAQSLYLVMEYLPGGDLASLVDREGGKLTVDQARFYLAETLVAVHELHRLGFVHRDVKPENLLLDRLGHIKLADFGSAARICADGRVLTAMSAGTPDYIAPEVLTVYEGEADKKTSYGAECDMWSIGVLAYKLVLGVAPFSSGRTSVTYNRIMTHSTVNYPDSLSVTDSLKDLINNLLRPKDSRLDYHNARKHLFFLEIDFNNLREVAPPIVPVVKSVDDTSNFGKVAQRSPPLKVTPRESNKEFSGKQLPFIGYTYSGYIKQREEQRKREQETPRNDETGRKEYQALLAKLLVAQKSSRCSDGARERADQERVQLQRELARERQLSAALRKQIEQEHEDRHRDEQKAKVMVRQALDQKDRERLMLLAEWQAKVDGLNDSLTTTHTLNNELTSRCERAEAQVHALRVEADQLKGLVKMYKEKVAKVRDNRRSSVSDMEIRLDKIQTQEEKWREQFNGQVKLRQMAIDDMQKTISEQTQAKNEWTLEKTRMEAKMEELRLQLAEKATELTAAEVHLADTSKLDALTARLNQEKIDNARLKAKIMSLETELSNTTESFLEHETVGQKSSLKELEMELKNVIEEKCQLQKTLQAMSEKENEQAAALSELEKMLSNLEVALKKLEKENADLKLAGPNAPKLASETELQYQQKITTLEQQVNKLDGQLERRLDAAINERQELRDTQSKLRKTEKDLADARIDIRIAKRETKTAEESNEKLKEELKTVNERLRRTQEENNRAMAEMTEKLEEVRQQLKNAEEQIEKLRHFEIEALKLSEAQSITKSENIKLRKQLADTERDLCTVKSQLEGQILKTQSLVNEKAEWCSSMEKCHIKIGGLELNNAMLRETSSMLDGQLDDYEIMVANLNSEIDNLRQENGVLTLNGTKLEAELTAMKTALAAEKAKHTEVKEKLEALNREVVNTNDLNVELRTHFQYSEETCEGLSAKLIEKEKQIRALELELSHCDQEIRQYQEETLWLKEEISKKISDIYLLRENANSLNQELEDREAKIDALDERNQVLEKTVSDHELFHKQREMKDKEQIGQLNKVIKFLQAQIDEKKKKQTLADKLFGRKRREPPSPQAPSCTSPKSTSDQVRKKLPTSPRIAMASPRSSQALSQIVSSPSSRMQRQMSLPRMHHKIPHRFKVQYLTVSTKCAACAGPVHRATRASVCTQCSTVSHNNCAPMAPKTCGLPAGLADHFVQSVKAPSTSEGSATSTQHHGKGWLGVIMPGESSWKKRYIELEGSNVKMYDGEPESPGEPCVVWPLLTDAGHAIISSDVAADELPTVAKSDLPFVIKIVRMSQTTCWPSESIYLLTSSVTDKTQWITALQTSLSSVSASSSAVALQPSNKMTHIFKDDQDLSVNCVQELRSDMHSVVLLGTSAGLYSVQSSDSLPVKLNGVTSVHSICVSVAINQVLLSVGEHNSLVTTNYRLLESNARSAACASPEITTETVTLDTQGEPITMMNVSEEINGTVFLAAATSKNLHICQWCYKSSKWVTLRTLPTPEPVKCTLFLMSNDALLVGSGTFQHVSLTDFHVKEIFNSRVSQRLLHMRSFPMRAAQINEKEMLLCFREFGVFVDRDGQKTRPDLKWAHAPKSFGYNAPYLFVINSSGVEIVKLCINSDSAGSSEDTVSIATTATLADIVTVPLDDAHLLGMSIKGGIYVRSGNDTWLLEGSRLCTGVAGSCATLDRVPSEGQFSFTSSLVGSLDGSDDDYSPERKLQHTEL